MHRRRLARVSSYPLSTLLLQYAETTTNYKEHIQIHTANQTIDYTLTLASKLLAKYLIQELQLIPSIHFPAKYIQIANNTHTIS